MKFLYLKVSMSPHSPNNNSQGKVDFFTHELLKFQDNI
jgi:hypothetical protein